jgi:hypothetical protein
MSLFVEELADYLVTKTIFTTKGGTGGDIFYSFFPDVSADPSGCVAESPGFPGPEGLPVYDSGVQVIVRGTNADTARQKAAAVYNEFHGLSNVALTSSHIMFAEGTAPPFNIGPDKRGRHLFTMNFHFRTRPASTANTAAHAAKGGDPNLV